MEIKSQCRTDCLGSDINGYFILTKLANSFPLNFLFWLMTVSNLMVEGFNLAKHDTS